ncbi:unnamed protein product, partial [Medioppia subpectinata]
MNFPKYVFSTIDAMVGVLSKFLNRFGYMEKMPKNNSIDMSSPKMKSVVMDFQRFMGIEETGSLDTKTMDMMNEPRCGVADNISSRTKRNYKMHSKHSKYSKRYRRYALQGSVWPTKNLTWKVTKYSNRDNLRGRDRDIDRLMEYALNEWSKNSGLNFVRETGNKKAMIEIGWKVMDHSDGNPF